MDIQQFYEHAARRAEQIINLIADRQYDKLPAVTGAIYLGWGERKPAEEELAFWAGAWTPSWSSCQRTAAKRM